MVSKSEFDKAIQTMTCYTVQDMENKFKKDYKKHPELKEHIDTMKKKECRVK